MISFLSRTTELEVGVCSVVYGAVSVHEAEPWVYVGQFDASKWNDVLVEYGVDTSARQQLFLLSQHSVAGAQAANDIMHNVMNTASIRNPSAFVYSAVVRARQAL